MPVITTSAARLFVRSSPPADSGDFLRAASESAGRSAKAVRFSTKVAVLPPPPLSPRELPPALPPQPPLHPLHPSRSGRTIQGARPRGSAYRHLPLHFPILPKRLVLCPNYLRTIVPRPTLLIRQSSRNQVEKRVGLGVADIICEQRWSGTRIVSLHFRFVPCLSLVSRADYRIR